MHSMYYFERTTGLHGRHEKFEYINVRTDKSILAQPDFNPVLVFTFGDFDNYYVMFDEDTDLMRVKKFHGGNNEGNPLSRVGYVHDETWFTKKDCSLLDPEDQYVREKIKRALKAKL